MKLLDQLVEERAEISAMQTALVTRASDEVRDLTEDEDKNLADFQERAAQLDRRIDDLRNMHASTLKADTMRAEMRALNADTPEEPQTMGQAVHQNEPLTHRSPNHHLSTRRNNP